ncbi:MAG: hypothetical protein SGCHY_004980 [Lobulomycetales sp.]
MSQTQSTYASPTQPHLYPDPMISQTTVYMNEPVKENTAAAGILALFGLCCFKLPATRVILFLTAGLGGVLTSFVWFGLFAVFRINYDNGECDYYISSSSSWNDDEREQCRVYESLFRVSLPFGIIFLLISLALVIRALQLIKRGNPNLFANLNLGVNGQPRQHQNQQMYQNQPGTTTRFFSAQTDSTMTTSQKGYHMANPDLEKNTSNHGSVVDANENIPLNATFFEPEPRMSLESLALYLDISKLMDASSVEEVLEMDLKAAKEKLGMSNDEYLRLKKYKKEISS